MVFSSLEFLFLFLPITLVLYFITPKKYRNIILVIFSLIFYAWGEPIYIFIMLFSTVFDYINGLLISKYKKEKKDKKARLVLIVSLIGNLGILGFFKYTDFLIGTINSLTGFMIPLMELALPIGISFYTFQTLSYTIDVYRGKVKAQKDIIKFATYVTLFPQLVAGPIVGYKDIEKDLSDRSLNSNMFSYGVERFTIGLFKKVMIANNIGLIWNYISSCNLNTLPIMTAWIGAFAFAFQIYFDFSGYSDMAIGLGKLFGFNFPENFDLPYTSKSITEFWRRWHISLGKWFKEYVYIPLGGSRCSKLKLIRNICVVWFLTGLWHGASWNFAIWGLYFAVFLTIEKLFLKKYLDKINPIVRQTVTFILVTISWVIFAFTDLSDAVIYLKSMLGMNNNLLWNSESLYLIQNNIFLIIVCVTLAFGLISESFKKKLESNKYLVVLNPIFVTILLLISISFLVGDTYNPFMYFRF